MSISIGPDIVIGRRGISLSGGGAAAIPWWLSGDISAANAIAVYQPIGAASLAASYVNLANPGTYDAAPGVAPTFDAATGWTFNGTTQWLNLPLSYPGDGSWSVVVRFTTVSGGNTFNPLIAADNVTPMLIGNRWDTTKRLMLHANGGPQPTGIVEAGAMAISGASTYIDGSLDQSLTLGSVTASSSIYLGRGSSYYGNCKIQAVAIYNTTLTAPQVAAVTTAMAALT